MKRVQVEQAKVKPGRVKKALAAGPHSKVVHTDGSKQSSPNQHKSTSGGNGAKGLKGL